MLIFSFSIIISFYHFGIEQGIIDESSICASDLNLITKDEILNSLRQFTISCKDVAFKIFGLSLTTYNIFISIFISICKLVVSQLVTPVIGPDHYSVGPKARAAATLLNTCCLIAATPRPPRLLDAPGGRLRFRAASPCFRSGGFTPSAFLKRGTVRKC